MIDRNTRFILWIDSVATVMVCPQSEIWIGQAVPTSGTHIAFQATLSRRHAKLVRDQGSYWLSAEAETSTKQDGVWVACPQEGTPLVDGQHLLLADTVNLQFSRPNPLTSSAVLRYASNHRTVPRTDFTILMSDACVLGAGSQSHIPIAGLPQATFFYSVQGVLQFRCKTDYLCNQKSASGMISVGDGDRIESPQFGLTVEAIGATG